MLGLNDTHISESGLRIVGIKISHDFFDTVCASSTQTISHPSKDLMDSTVLVANPVKLNVLPLRPRISASRTS